MGVSEINLNKSCNTAHVDNDVSYSLQHIGKNMFNKEVML